MYFPNYRLRKRWLDKCLENPVLEVSSTTNMGKGPKTVEICTTLPLPYLFISVDILQLVKFCVSSMQILKAVCYHIDWRWQVFSSIWRKFNATNSDTILSETKGFLQFLAPFLKSTLNFDHFQKKMTLIVDVCPKLPSPKKVIR